jgi:hypothetical protein
MCFSETEILNVLACLSKMHLEFLIHSTQNWLKFSINANEFTSFSIQRKFIYIKQNFMPIMVISNDAKRYLKCKISRKFVLHELFCFKLSCVLFSILLFEML